MRSSSLVSAEGAIIPTDSRSDGIVCLLVLSFLSLYSVEVQGARTKRIGVPNGPVSPGAMPPASPHPAILMIRPTTSLPLQSIVPPLFNPSIKTSANPTTTTRGFVPPGTSPVGQKVWGGVPKLAQQTSQTRQ